MQELSMDSQELVKKISSHIKASTVFLKNKMTATSDDANPSTNVDIQISNFLIEKLRNELDVPILSEEGDISLNLQKDGLLWVIDPLDGTLNALTGNIPYCISVTLISTKRVSPLLSCNYIPHSDEMYTAIKGQGAFLNERKINAPVINNNLISYGLPGDVSKNAEWHAKHFRSVVSQGYILRQTGSAINDILLTAKGKFNGFYEFGLYLWDFIGADLIALESGCHSFFTLHDHNNRLRYDYVVATSLEELNKLKSTLDII